MLGAGYRWTAEQMNGEAVARVRAGNLRTLREGGVASIETNVLYAVARKP